MSPHDTVTSYSYPQKVIFIVLFYSQLQWPKQKKMNFFLFVLCPSSYFKEAAYILMLIVIVLPGAWHNN